MCQTTGPEVRCGGEAEQGNWGSVSICSGENETPGLRVEDAGGGEGRVFFMVMISSYGHVFVGVFFMSGVSCRFT